MSPFDLARSVQRARARLGSGPARSRRARRSDRGVSRLAPGVQACLSAALEGQERPPMRALLAQLAVCCEESGLRAPSRATVYNRMVTHATPRFRVGELPAPVRASLYNLDLDSEVPAHQVAFHAFNYGDLDAVSFAAGLPWLALYQARRMRGWRVRSRGLLDAVACVRGI